ncbi:ArpU family phage packaging/lysis transcriptional regulator [Lacticaseibacillus daqingensis]|uniref:ArpU family phage packaging/lysis transcriptional regulator n=1 Tax=Lacticaseibacillus daqingensis TaxID=2486014 RepID=UPI000F768C93|nr:ArpU family phage packaging/lysis transcriptional regulator [Lacticaseibacillus daqingensis]
MRRPQHVIPNIDTKATATNAAAMLQNYHRMRAIARRPIVTGAGPLTGMPASAPEAGRTERHMVEAINARAFVDAATQAAQTVREVYGEEKYTILKCLYLGAPVTAENIMLRLGMSNTAYYHAKEDALVGFAEAFPVDWGELLVVSGGDRHESN